MITRTQLIALADFYTYLRICEDHLRDGSLNDLRIESYYGKVSECYRTVTGEQLAEAICNGGTIDYQDISPKTKLSLAFGLMGDWARGTGKFRDAKKS